MTLKQAVQTLNEEYYRQLKGIEATIPHDRVEYISTNNSVAIPWEDVLAVFAADMAADEHGQQVVALDDAQLEQLRTVLADMHQISHSTRTVEHEEEIITTDEDGNEITEWVTVSETVLEIKVSHKTAAEMATAYGFTPRQNEQLALLSDPQYDVLWMELLGGYVSGGQIIDPDTDWVGTGIFAWPLPQSFTITSPFGYRQDPFTGEWSYHNGTDIAAPQGTPILAAADGTVTIANGTDPWGGSYGYYIKLDHGEGIETLYAHAALDQMAIAKRVRELRLPDRVLVYPGADEVGSVLFARVFNQIKNYRPRIYIRYSSVYGPFIVPRYEDRPLQEGIKAQITSLGGVVLDAPGDSDCMLAVNSPGKHMIESVEQYTKDLTFSTHLNLNELFRYMHYYHEEYGRPVGLAEVSVANGCENDCMELGLLTGTYDYLTAVGGWNTAQNTIGVVLAQLVIASYYNGFCGRPEQLRRSEEFMASRLASDWLYQSNVLHRYLAETAGTVDPYALGRHYRDAVEYFRHGLQALLDEKFTAGIRGRRPIVDTLQFQWDGIFYIRLHVRLEEVLRAEGTKEKTDTGE